MCSSLNTRQKKRKKKSKKSKKSAPTELLNPCVRFPQKELKMSHIPPSSFPDCVLKEGRKKGLIKKRKKKRGNKQETAYLFLLSMVGAAANYIQDKLPYLVFESSSVPKKSVFSKKVLQSAILTSPEVRFVFV
jgi:hypothetical protein